jgi:hypothetical protein
MVSLDGEDLTDERDPFSGGFKDYSSPRLMPHLMLFPDAAWLGSLEAVSDCAGRMVGTRTAGEEPDQNARHETDDDATDIPLPDAAMPDSTSILPTERTATKPRGVNWRQFAIGKDANGTWHHFRFRDGRWEHFGRLKVRRRGSKQDGLLDLFLKGAGRLTEGDAVGLWHDPSSMRQATRDKLEPELTHLRNAIRNARRAGKETSDPLPARTVDGARCWIAEVQFGHAGPAADHEGDLDPAVHFFLAQEGVPSGANDG